MDLPDLAHEVGEMAPSTPAKAAVEHGFLTPLDEALCAGFVTPVKKLKFDTPPQAPRKPGECSEECFEVGCEPEAISHAPSPVPSPKPSPVVQQSLMSPSSGSELRVRRTDQRFLRDQKKRPRSKKNPDAVEPCDQAAGRGKKRGGRGRGRGRGRGKAVRKAESSESEASKNGSEKEDVGIVAPKAKAKTKGAAKTKAAPRGALKRPAAYIAKTRLSEQLCGAHFIPAAVSYDLDLLSPTSYPIPLPERNSFREFLGGIFLVLQATRIAAEPLIPEAFWQVQWVPP